MQRELSGVPQKPRQRSFIQSPYRTVHEAAEFLRLSPMDDAFCMMSMN